MALILFPVIAFFGGAIFSAMIHCDATPIEDLKQWWKDMRSLPYDESVSPQYQQSDSDRAHLLVNTAATRVKLDTAALLAMRKLEQAEESHRHR